MKVGNHWGGYVRPAAGGCQRLPTPVTTWIGVDNDQR